MKTMKRIAAFLLTTAIVMSFSVPAFAADSVVSFKGRTSGFGFQPGSEYTETDLFDGFKNVMPGDVLTETIKVENKVKNCDYVKVYLQAVVHDENGNPITYSETFEETDGKDQDDLTGRDETVATMQDFLSQLTMRVYLGDESGKVLYEGTPADTGALTNNVHLGNLDTNESVNLVVKLEVPEDLGNKYANRVGEVDWVFKADLIKKETILPGLPPLIQTGQLNWPIPVLGGLGILLVLFGVVVMRKRRNNDNA